jgi:hypothetical protein
MPPTSCVGVVCWRQFASRGAADRARRVADLVEKIKVARVTNNAKETKLERLADTAQQSYRCVIGIVISSSLNEAPNGASDDHLAAKGFRFMNASSAWVITG